MVASLGLFACMCLSPACATQSPGAVRVDDGKRDREFAPRFTVLYRPDDPELALRRLDLEEVSYSAPSWKSVSGDAGGLRNDDTAVSAGDGLDARILGGSIGDRTPDLFHAAAIYTLDEPTSIESHGSERVWTFEAEGLGRLVATVDHETYEAARVRVSFTAERDGYFSIGYTGAPAVSADDLDEVWQPLIWHERRFPKMSYATPSFMATLPTALVSSGGVTVGVAADPSMVPFQPLPLLENSQFMLASRDESGMARPMVFAPMLGGMGSEMRSGVEVSFDLHLIAEAASVDEVFESTARELCGFEDVRENLDENLNATLERMIEYGMSSYSRFNDALRGCAYDTDVPSAVKNVSALHPLSVAIVTDDAAPFEERALPIHEYLLSREKLLFNIDPEVKIQSPSSAMRGPASNVSELAAWHAISGGRDLASLTYAERLLDVERTLNLDVVERGDTWQSLLAIGTAGGAAERSRVDDALVDMERYVEERVETAQVDYSDPDSRGMFFWTSFVPRFMDLYWAYEETGEAALLQATHEAARAYATFCWMFPAPPEGGVLVNEGGYAPQYWYLQRKGHERMEAAEREVPAWQLSELGLTPESSGTAHGHRGIFMATYAPFMMRVAADTGDPFLRDIARSAIVGRYRNFPGYHINTARTDVYMNADYPLRDHKAIGYNSMHYNHVWPMISMLIDYLAADVYDASDGAIDFPGRFVEGYAYLQQLAPGDRVGRFYDRDDARLWMPAELVDTGNPQLNWIAARGDGRVYVALVNQSDRTVEADVRVDTDRAGLGESSKARVWVDNGRPERADVRGGRLPVRVPARGIVAFELSGATPDVRFQERVGAGEGPGAGAVHEASMNLGDAGEVRAALVDMGQSLASVYVYSRAAAGELKRCEFACRGRLVDGTWGEWERVDDAAYPFEARFAAPENSSELEVRVRTSDATGAERSGVAMLRP